MSEFVAIYLILFFGASLVAAKPFSGWLVRYQNRTWGFNFSLEMVPRIAWLVRVIGVIGVIAGLAGLVNSK